jgi:hypothetical protein
MDRTQHDDLDELLELLGEEETVAKPSPPPFSDIVTEEWEENLEDVLETCSVRSCAPFLGEKLR